ncbi:MAG: hypothetical protein KAU14_07255 [Thermoplasmata archaeon]|nr:hypothetical protein [Thermoplasmata archaeon]
MLKLKKEGSEVPAELVRPAPEDWEKQIARTRAFREKCKHVAAVYPQQLKEVGGKYSQQI